MITSYENQQSKEQRLLDTTREALAQAKALWNQQQQQEAKALIQAQTAVLSKEWPGYAGEPAFAEFMRFAQQVTGASTATAEGAPQSAPVGYDRGRGVVSLGRYGDWGFNPKQDQKFVLYRADGSGQYADSTGKVYNRKGDPIGQMDVSQLPVWSELQAEGKSVQPRAQSSQQRPAGNTAQPRQQQASNYDNYFHHIVNSEGGYVNDPHDRGGATMRGVTQRTYDSYRRRHNLGTQDVRKITQAEVEQIYREGYWNAVSGDQLPADIAFVVFDAAINHGPATAVRLLRQSLGMSPSGGMTQEVIDRARKANDNQIANGIIDARLRYYDAIIARDSSQARFRNGWRNRMTNLRNQINQ